MIDKKKFLGWLEEKSRESYYSILVGFYMSVSAEIKSGKFDYCSESTTFERKGQHKC